MENIKTEVDLLPQKLVYSVAEAAEMLGVSSDKVYELVRCGQIPHKRLGVRRIVIPAKPFHIWIESCTQWESINA
jgi:excisionase family DNA binding protein